MKKVILISTVAFMALAFTSCSNNKQEDVTKAKQGTPAVVAAENETPKVSETGNLTGELLSQIDTSEVKTFDDYYAIKGKLFGEYYAKKNSAFGEYWEKKNDAFGEYWEKRQDALMVVREKNKAKYLEWLDAEKMGDYAKKKAIEGSPEFAEYVSVEKTEHAKYKEAERSLHDAYKQTEKNSYAEYKQKEALAYQAYQKRR